MAVGALMIEPGRTTPAPRQAWDQATLEAVASVLPEVHAI
jgi:hypothetical protein